MSDLKYIYIINDDSRIHGFYYTLEHAKETHEALLLSGEVASGSSIEKLQFEKLKSEYMTIRDAYYAAIEGHTTISPTWGNPRAKMLQIRYHNAHEVYTRVVNALENNNKTDAPASTN